MTSNPIRGRNFHSSVCTVCDSAFRIPRRNNLFVVPSSLSMVFAQSCGTTMVPNLGHMVFVVSSRELYCQPSIVVCWIGQHRYYSWQVRIWWPVIPLSFFFYWDMLLLPVLSIQKPQPTLYLGNLGCFLSFSHDGLSRKECIVSASPLRGWNTCTTELLVRRNYLEYITNNK